MKRYTIGTDIGTSSTKSIIMDREGSILSENTEEYEILCPKPAWAEQDASVWEKAVYNTIRGTISEASIDPKQIGGVYISGLFAGSGVPVDAKNNPVRNAIIWMDRRAEYEQILIEKKIGSERLFSISGNRNDAYFGYAKILWIKHNEPEIWKKIRMFLPSNSYMVYKLTGKITIDHTAAANVGGIYDMSEHRWSNEMMVKMDIPVSMMPTDFFLPTDIVGGITSEASVRTGLPKGVPICAGGTDCLSSTLATGAMNPGDQVAVIGTSINWGVLHRDFPKNQRCVTMPYILDTKTMYYTYGGATTAGALTKWLKDEIYQFSKDASGTISPADYDSLSNEASQLSPGSDGLIVLPYFMGTRTPLWDSNAKGTIFGLTLHHKRAHLFRAFLESVAFSLRDIIDSSDIVKTETGKCVITGGTVRSNLWMQIIADVTGLKIYRTKQDMQAPFANAVVAAVRNGLMQDYSILRDLVKYDEPFVPNAQSKIKYDVLFRLYKKLYEDLKDRMQELSEIY